MITHKKLELLNGHAHNICISKNHIPTTFVFSDQFQRVSTPQHQILFGNLEHYLANLLDFSLPRLRRAKS